MFPLYRTVAIAALLAVPAWGGAAVGQPASGAATAERGTAMQVTLDKVTNPKGRLANASVQDKNGASVGSVREVTVNADGSTQAVRVDVGGFLGIGSKLVEIAAADLRYEQDRNVLTTTLRKEQIQALPEAKA